jgi:hypothetical protein
MRRKQTMTNGKTAPQKAKPPRGTLRLSDEGIPCGEDGNPLDPPLLLIAEIAGMNLLGVKERRLQEMIEQGVLPAQKATAEQQAALIRSGRIEGKQITFKGVYLVEPDSLNYADANRKKVGFPTGQDRSKRGKTTGAAEGQR